MSTDTSDRPRRRVRTAQAALNRIHAQQQRFATAYAAAETPQRRFNAAADALRAAAAERLHRDNPAVSRQLESLTEQITQLVDTLHDLQQRRAERVLRDDERRQARNERRRDEHSAAQ